MRLYIYIYIYIYNILKGSTLFVTKKDVTQRDVNGENKMKPFLRGKGYAQKGGIMKIK